ncbi:nibrin [Microdochium nivale]|nr:nibrin [Microdochium nivale]
MWILENEGGAFEGRRLWLRPGKRYLFGRTVAEPGQLAIKGDLSKSVSRKHCTITVDAVPTGDGLHPTRRSRVTVEDLGSKGGTRINDNKIKGETVVLSGDTNTLQMGSFQSKFHIAWKPVVLSYSFSAKELRANPLSNLQDTLEQLDIKYISDYDAQRTTHVVTRKRNTPKGLQALINARHIVGAEFVDAVVAAASLPENGGGFEASMLESDFDKNWPDAMAYLPPVTDEGVPRPDSVFAPDPQRAEIFDGYTFIFYNKKQWEPLMAPITAGKGKALLYEVVAKDTEVDDFIRHVKGVAGEKGLGEFEDGSEGKGVVVVRWLPNDGEHLEWFTNFYTTISLRLDHRLIDQKDFIGAILGNDASVLRRPLEEEESQSADTDMRREQPSASAQHAAGNIGESTPRVSVLQRRREKLVAGSRFKGFGIDIDDDDEPPKPERATTTANVPEVASQESLFVAQDDDGSSLSGSATGTGRLQRKRAASPAEQQVDIMEGFAPTAAQVKRRRIEAGDEPIPRRASPPPQTKQRQADKPVKVKKEMDVLGVARQHREEAEARARAEKAELETAPEGLDLAEIRRMQITEPMALREAPVTRTREQDIADGRWNAAWNGRKNFKKFQKRGAEQGRALQKIIVPLEQVQTKAFGIGADYWLEDGSQHKNKKKQSKISQVTNTQSQDMVYEMGNVASGLTVSSNGSRPGQIRRGLAGLPPVDGDDDEGEDEVASSRGAANKGQSQHNKENNDEDDDDDDDGVVISMSAPRSSRTTAASATGKRSQISLIQQRLPPTSSRSTISTTQNSTTQRSQPSRATAAAMATIRGKRPAAEALPVREQPASKRTKGGAGGVAASVTIAASDDSEDDDSEDELRFKFKRR